VAASYPQPEPEPAPVVEREPAYAEVSASPQG